MVKINYGGTTINNSNGVIENEVSKVLTQNFQNDRDVQITLTTGQKLLFTQPFADESCTSVKDQNTGQLYYY